MLLTGLGLCLNILGVVLAFFFGFPQPSHEEGVALGLEPGTLLPDGRTVVQHDAQVQTRKRVYARLSYCALGLILIGFSLQLADLIIKAQ